MRGSGPKAEYDVKSAFQAFYFFIFMFAVIALVVGMGHGGNPAKDELMALANIAAKTSHADRMASASGTITVFFWIFFSTFAFHLLRIYMTLELMEEEYGSFTNFYASYTPVGRFFDFLARFAIVAVLTLKVIPIVSFDGFMAFVLYFYVALTAWGLVAWSFGGKGFFGAFLVSSLSGLFVSALLRYVHMDWAFVLILCTAATMLLAADLLICSKFNLCIKKVGKDFVRKWLSWRSTPGAPANPSTSVPAAE